MKNAKATVKGWVNPKTGELLKAQKMTQAKADELNGVVPKPVVEVVEPPKAKKVRKPKPAVEEVTVEVEPQVVEEPEVAPAPKTSFFNKFTN
jgi:hypothetical protein